MSSISAFEELRLVGFAAITPAFVNFGAATTHMIRQVTVKNNTDGDMLISVNSTVANLYIPAGSSESVDIQANINPQFDDKAVLPIGTQFKIMYDTAPTKGKVSISCLY